MSNDTLNRITDEEINDSELPETGVCCLCGGEYTEYGNNPDPVCTIPNARCCHKCNWERVLPARGLKLSMSYEKYLKAVELAEMDTKDVYLFFCQLSEYLYPWTAGHKKQAHMR